MSEPLGKFFHFFLFFENCFAVSDAKFEQTDQLTCAVAETGHSRLGVLSRELLISTVALGQERNFAKRKDLEVSHATLLLQIRRNRNSATSATLTSPLATRFTTSKTIQP